MIFFLPSYNYYYTNLFSIIKITNYINYICFSIFMTQTNTHNEQGTSNNEELIGKIVIPITSKWKGQEGTVTSINQKNTLPIGVTFQRNYYEVDFKKEELIEVRE